MQQPPRSTHAIRLLGAVGALLFVAAALLLQGCESGARVQGTVLDFKGEPLPGVAVLCPLDNTQVITNALGEYTLRAPLGDVNIQYRKTGYTPGSMHFDIQAQRLVEANPMLLWPLPIEKGVYLFDDFQYQALERMEPEAYQGEDGSPIFALPRSPETEIDVESVRLLAYDMPAFDVRLHRLSEITARKPLEGAMEEQVWGPVESMNVLSAPIDEPEKLLLEIDLLSSIQPGVYAVHWGALDGYTTLDPRCFVFRAVGPPDEDAAAEEDEEKAEDEEASSQEDDSEADEEDADA